MTKAQEERLVEGLEKARDAITNIIEGVETGDTSDIFDALESVDLTLGRVYKQMERAERMESEGRR